ncbi:MoaD family protein [Thermoplasmatales archaeon SCGC AB-540-F20]|nr:MoaD family protein [Thermoplasmatales archaeon SCGC AB-540-F20]
MKLKIKFLKPFSDAVGKSELELDFDGITLEDMLKVLVNRYPKLKKEFYTKTDELTDYMCMFVNDKPISALNGINTELKNGDELLFFIPVSGG